MSCAIGSPSLRRGRLPRYKRPINSFTLIEVLVSVTILVLLVIVLTQVLTLADNTWMTGEASKERMQNERALGNFIVSELRMALLPAGRQSINSLQFVVNPTGVTSSYNNNDSVFWQAPIATDTTYGDVAEVGYFVQWNTANPQNPEAILSRFFVNPPAYGAGNTNYLIYSQPSAWINNSMIQAVAPANSANSYQGLFAENVVGLWVQCLDSYGQRITQDYYGHTLALDAYDSRNGYTDSQGNRSPSYLTTNAAGTTTVTPYCALPRMVSLSLVLLDSHAGRRVGPSQMAAIQNLVASSATSATPANTFVTSALANVNLIPIKQDLRPFQTVIYLEGSR